MVIKTLVGHEDVVGDIQEDVPQQVALGNDEVDHEVGVPVPVDFKSWVDSAATVNQLTDLFQKAKSDGYWTHDIQLLLTARKVEIEAGK